MNQRDSFSDLKAVPWRSKPAGDFDELVTMLKHGELAMLRHLTGIFYSGIGSIIDAGSFVGGSTVALAAGLRDSNKAGTVYSYDRFIAPKNSPVMNQMIGVKEGESFRSFYDDQIKPFGDVIETYEGNFEIQPIPDGPIEILFVDLAKAAHVNDYIVTNLMPRLIPNRSVLVHQDYLYYGLPWIHVTMESLSDYFSILCHEANSVVFGCEKPIPTGVARSATWEATPIPRRKELMANAINRWTGREREFLETTRIRANL